MLALFSKKPQGPTRLILGLGNPGERYAATRHNAGWLALDALATELGAANAKWRLRSDALITEKPREGTQLILAKPQTMMNASGRAAKGLLKHYGLTTAELIVIHDDIDLPAGTLRLKDGGGHGGHNGIRDLVAAVGPDFIRIKIGVGAPPGRMDSADYVLQALRGDTLEELKIDAARAASAALALLDTSLVEAQNQFN